MSDYWKALTGRQRLGFVLGLLTIVVVVVGIGIALLRDPYVPVAPGLAPERSALIVKELEQAKIAYRVAEDGSLEAPRSLIGKARAVVIEGGQGLPANVGLELFKDTDFSTTDFAQKVNYQRALQGELTRTIQTLAGVSSARVHVILPEGGLLRRNAGKATAAIGVTMLPGRSLGQAQVRGIQRIVAASVPNIKIDDVVVFNEAGTSLTRNGGEAEGEMSSFQLEIKRQVDAYLEAKLGRLLQELVPRGTFSVSVDASLDYRQVKQTVDEPIAAPGPKDAERATGVVTKERQLQRTTPTGATEGASVDNSESEYEYKVGHRVEQTLSMPGTVKRLSVAVVLRGADQQISAAALEQLLGHAVGVERSRGDSVAVLMAPPEGVGSPAAAALVEAPPAPISRSPLELPLSTAAVWPYALVLSFVAFVLWFLGKARRKSERAVDIEAATVKVKSWLDKGAGDAAG